MTGRPFCRHLLIVGPGRLGRALGTELLGTGQVAEITLIGHRDRPDFVTFDAEGFAYLHHGEPLPPTGDAIILTVPDDAISDAAHRIAESARPEVPVLHTSGVLGSEVLEPLARIGHPTGSVHPLVSIAEPGRDSAKLRGAWFGAEGSAGALSFACSLVSALGGTLIRVDPAGKPLYHAAAVFASNYAVALLAVAERVMRQAGVEPGLARAALSRLAAGAVENVASSGPVEALTGPISRGDVETIERHLSRLSEEDRQLYSVLADETILLAQARGLSPGAATRLADLLHGAHS